MSLGSDPTAAKPCAASSTASIDVEAATGGGGGDVCVSIHMN